VLFDVAPTAREAGIRWPVALTAGVRAKCVAVPHGVVCQDEAGRLWDVLSTLRFAIRGSQRERQTAKLATQGDTCVPLEKSRHLAHLEENGSRSKATSANDRWKADDTWEINAFFQLGKVKQIDLKPPKRD
jgi:hypothetical protein